ncbi:DUF1905 domain-containing protein [bacterium]|nr:MAG: DUF1905 domain-containing protein [bacterium]
MVLEFSGEAISWRGPAPYVFVPVPLDLSEEIKAVASLATYGWGAIPVTVWIGETESTTSLFPKDGRYLVPVKKAVQERERLSVGDRTAVRLELTLR